MTAATHPDRLGRYEILGALASGGMAELFLARLPGVEGFAKRVVIKRVLPGLARDREFVEMFLAEARVAAGLAHQNIVHVHDIGFDGGGYFFAMELLHGADVGTVLRAAIERDGALPLGIALEIARAACAGLHYAHERVGSTGAPLGLVHRDVSPQNLFVTFDGGIKVLDFGIAKAVEKISNHYTRSGTLRGKLPYMSPEQCRTEPLDRRSDVFSLAIVVWEMTVGERLYGGAGEGDFAILKAICDADAPAPTTRKAGYPPELERIVMTALRRDRDARYPSADAFAADLERFVRAHGLWTPAREIAAYMAQRFPDRAAEWKRDVKDETTGAAVIPLVRHTVELPPDRPERPARDESVDRPAPAPALAPPSAPGPVAAPVSALVAAAAARTAPRASRVPWIIAIVATAGLAVAVGYVVGHRGRTTTAAPSKPPPPAPISEDSQWFQADDYLVSEAPYQQTRLDGLRVAKMMAQPARAGALTTFVDGNGKEVESEYYWKSRIATPDELGIGALAFCFVDPFEHNGHAPATKRESRTRTWTLARVTEIADRAAGRVTIGNVDCPVAAVRVPVE